MKFFKHILFASLLFTILFGGIYLPVNAADSRALSPSLPEYQNFNSNSDGALLIPLPPKVKNYIEDGKTSPTSPLQGAGNVQLLDVGPKRISDIVFGFMSLITVVIALRAGISVLFSKGDAAKFKNGIMAIVYAAVGIVLIGSAWMIVRLVLSINLGT